MVPVEVGCVKYTPDESYENWLEKVQQAEYQQALKNLAKGEPIDLVLEKLSKRLMNKVLHPVLKSLKESPDNYNTEESKAAYEKAYLSQRKSPPADHITED
jgi:glutamyl-tRNA reductase